MAAEREPWLRATGLTKAYGGVLALADATLELRAGELRGLVGANGAGKSTLVKILTGLVAPTRGEVTVDGRPLRLGHPTASLRAGIASVPQELAVASTMTVAENVLLGHEPRGALGRLRERELRRAAARV
ncbi:MAG TPA: ATP-binding cassette domain-containing protein, partial [Candidatus Tectomicrobia bacterium]|nr:ATP-binding cassette domain-containing protein [Candidatus Tectomicrobia bacterium]